MEHILAGPMTTQGAYSSGADDGDEGTVEESVEEGKSSSGSKSQPISGKAFAEKAGVDMRNPSKVLNQKAQPQAKAVEQAEVKAEAQPEDELSEEYLDKKVVITVDGEKHRMTVREAMKLQQLEKASRSKINEATAKERKMQQLLQRLDNPEEYFKTKGLNPIEFAEMTLKKQIELLNESPEQRKYREAQEKLARYEEQEKQAAAQRAQAEEMKIQTQYNNEFVEAWKETGLPPDRKFGQMVAAEMLAATRRGEDLQWKEAAVKVKEAFDALLTKTVRSEDPEGILRRLGPEKEKALREYFVSRVSGVNPTSGKQVPSPNSGTRPAQMAKGANETASKLPGKNLNEREWLEWFKNH